MKDKQLHTCSVADYGKLFRYKKNTKKQNVRPGQEGVSRTAVYMWIRDKHKKIYPGIYKDGNGAPITIRKIGKRIFIEYYK